MITPANLWHQVFDKANGYCEYCNQDLLLSIAAMNAAQVDHVLARAKGGKDELENLRLACSLCNSSLAKFNHLTTFEARKERIQSRLAIHEGNWRDKRAKLRKTV